MLQKLKLSLFTFLKIHFYHYKVSILTLLMSLPNWRFKKKELFWIHELIFGVDHFAGIWD